MRRLAGMCLSLAAAALVAAGCGGDGATSQPAGEVAPGDGGMHHVHGLGVAGETLYVATHDGLWIAPPDTTRVERFGESRQDVMGFSVIDERRFVGSGHPAPGDAGQPPNLGLIESTDGGRSWRSVSLLGEVDFHVLEAAGRHVYGVDSGTGMLLASADAGRSWGRRTPPAGVFSLAIDPRDPSAIVVSTEAGLFASADGGEGWRPLSDRLAGLLAWPGPRALQLVDAEGTVHRSGDGGGSWEAVGEAGGQPVAFTAAEGDLYVALADNRVKRSADGGRTWTVRAAP